MTATNLRAAWVGLVVLGTIACGAAPPNVAAPSTPSAPESSHSAPDEPAITVGTRHSMHSKVLEEDRPYWVALPPSYDVAADKRYPVLYLLDGAAHFQSAAGVIQFMSAGINANKQIPELILVAVPNTNRTRDLTPTHSTTRPDGKEWDMLRESGGGDAFLSFLADELVPTIDKHFRTQPHRTLAGHSFGGLLALHALLEKPSAFQAHIAIDPSLWWDEEVLPKRLETRVAKGYRPSGAVHISLATHPDIGLGDPKRLEKAARAFANSLEPHRAPSFQLRLQVHGDEDHGSVPLQGLYAGLLTVFDGYRLSLADIYRDPSVVRTRFAALSARLGFDLRPPEGLVDMWGTFLLEEHGNKEGAQLLFELNAEMHPSSENATWRLQSLTGDGPKEVEVDASTLATYAGVYEFSPEFHVTIRVEGGHLVARATGQGDLALFAESSTTFFAKAINAKVQFESSASGTARAMVLIQNGHRQTAPKIK